MKILFKYATRSRPAWFKKTLMAYKSLLSGFHECEFVVTCDYDDVTMANTDVRKFMDKMNVHYYFGRSESKVAAINANMKKHSFDILVVVSDDMVPIVRKFDDIIVQDMLKYFPDLDGALHYNDLSHCRDKVISLSILGRKLYDRFGYIYWHGYKSLWCDNEFTEICRQLKKVQWIDVCIIKHEWMKGGMDSLYKRNEALFNEDGRLFHKRIRQAFPGALQDETQSLLKPHFPNREHKEEMKTK